MLTSSLNPDKIIGSGSKAVTPETFSNFMSGNGGSTLGSSIVNNAANNISNFSRAKISAPNTLNFASTIQNISTNITNNVDNSVHNTLNVFKTQIQSAIAGMQTQVQRTLGDSIKNLSKNYQKTTQDKEGNNPSNILKNFLGLYRNINEFASFFGESKNSTKIRSALKGLRKVFDESFEVASYIRQIIVKIVKQLSSLPKASGSSGSLMMDIKVPGGQLKQSGGTSIRNFAKTRLGRLLGIGSAGIGGASAGSALSMQNVKDYQEQQLQDSVQSQSESDTSSDNFSSKLEDIVNNFSDTANSLSGLMSKGGLGLGMGMAAAAMSGGGPSSNPPPSTDNPPDSKGANSPAVNAPISEQITSIAGSSANYNTYKESLASIESGGKYDISGGKDKNYHGRYQLGVNEISSAASRAGVPTPTIRQFRKNPQLQELLMQHYTMMNYERLQSDSPKFRAMSEKEKLAVLGYAHNQGAGNAVRWVESGMGAGGRDSFNTPGRKYYELVLKRLGTQSTSNPVQPTTTKPAPQPQTSQVQPAAKPQQPAQQNVTTSPTDRSSANTSQSTNVATIQAPPQVTVIPGGGGSSGGGSPTPTASGGGAGTPDMSMYASTMNSNNPYWALPYLLGILNA